MEISKGTYIGTLVDYGYGTFGTKNTPAIKAVFEIEEHGQKKRITWTGWLTQKAAENTFDTLFVLGWNLKDAAELFRGQAGGALEIGKQVKLKIEEETHDGKTFPTVRWINPISGEKFKALDPAEAHAVVKSLGLEAELLKARESRGIKSGAVVANSTEDDLPF
jgi:hypothetical protein